MIPVSNQRELVNRLLGGQVGVIPTDTVYGLVASAHQPLATRRLYNLKSRENKPGTVIAADTTQLQALGLNEDDLAEVSYLWPNPVSVILAAPPWLAYLHLGTGSLAVRVPDDQVLHELLRQTGPLLTSSANLPGQPPANNLAEAESYFERWVDFYVDGGDFYGHKPSTLVRYSNTLTVIRRGSFQLPSKPAAKSD